MMRTSTYRTVGSAAAAGAFVMGLGNLLTLVALGREELLLSPDALLPLTGSAVGLIVVRAVPANAVGWLLIATAVSSALFGTSALLVAESPDIPGLLLTIAAWLSAWVWLPSYLITFFFLPLLFPDGRLRTGIWRHVLRTGVLLLAVESLLLAFGSTESVEPSIANPLVVEPVAELLAVVEPVIYLSMALLVVLGVASLGLRFVRSQGATRVQVLCVLVAAVAGVLYHLLTSSGLLLALLLPVAIAVAVLRFRLYEVERLLTRTIVYGGLAGSATLAYVLIVLTIGRAFGAERDLRVQSVALIVCVLLIHPLRDRFVHLAQRLVHGRRSGPYEVLAQLARQVGAAVSPEETLPQMAETIAAALQTRHVTVTASLSGGGTSSWRVPATLEDVQPGEGLVRRVVHQGVEVGTIRLIRDDALTGQESELLDVLVAQAGPSLHAVALTAQLRAQLDHAVEQAEVLRSSRARLVSAHDSARRAIERDLHDGAQQGLLALAVQLGRVQRKVDQDPRQAVVELADLQELARRTLVDLRALAAGAYPSVLRELGLAAALRERTADAAQEVVVNDELVQRPSPEVETALYFACMEAVTNALKHSLCSRIDVRLVQDAQGVVGFSVTDDGRGFDSATTAKGNGLTGMDDRLGVFGGSVLITSEPGSGTTVRGFAQDEASARYSSTA